MENKKGKGRGEERRGEGEGEGEHCLPNILNTVKKSVGFEKLPQFNVAYVGFEPTSFVKLHKCSAN